MDTVDIAVIGGGVVGALVSYEVARAFPEATIAVLERGLIGHGASSRSAGVHFPRGATEHTRSMTRRSQQYWRTLAPELHLPIHEIDATVTAAAANAASVRAAYLELGDQTASGELLTWAVPGCHYADVEGVVQRIVAALRGRVTVWEGTEVVDLSVGEEHRIRLGQGRELRAHRVVIAPGPWIAHSAWAELVAGLGLRVKKIVATHLESTPAEEQKLEIFHDEDAFLLPVHHRGHLLFSYTCDEWDVYPDALTGQLDQADIDQARGVLARYAPESANRIDSGRVFCDAYSPAREPAISEVVPGVLFVGAAGGSGYRLAPAMAAEAVTALTTKPIHP